MSSEGSFQIKESFDTFDEAFDFLDEKSSEIPEFMGRMLYIESATLYVDYDTKKWTGRIKYGIQDPQSDFADMDGLAAGGGW